MDVKLAIVCAIGLCIMWIIACVCSKKAGGILRRFMIDPSNYKIEYSPDIPTDTKVALLDADNSIYPHILADVEVKAVNGQVVEGAARPLRQIIVAITPAHSLWGGDINITRYDYNTGEELERWVYKVDGSIGVGSTRYICHNDENTTNIPAAMKACKVPTYFEWDPTRLRSPITDINDPPIVTDIDERAYKANLYKDFDYDDVHPKNLYTQQRYADLIRRHQNDLPYTRVALTARDVALTARAHKGGARYYDSNPFQESPFAKPIYNVTLLNSNAVENMGTDSTVQITLYNQLTGKIVAGPANFNQYGLLSVGQEGKETQTLRGEGNRAVPLQYIIVVVSNPHHSAWLGDVLVQAGREEVEYRAYDTQVGSAIGEMIVEYRCYDGSIYGNLKDAMRNCTLDRKSMGDYVTRQIHLNTPSYQR